MIITKSMEERAKATGTEWHDEGDGYASLIGYFYATVTYLAIPEIHPDVNKSNEDLCPDVNGGLTFRDGNVFGWDYGHYRNTGTPQKDIKSAINWFKRRAKK